MTLTAQTVGLVCLLAVVPFYGGHLQRGELAWSAAGGVFGGIGIALLYHALAIGKMGVVSPVTAVLAAAFPVVVGVVRGDALAWFQMLGIAVALVAVVLISRHSGDPSGFVALGTAVPKAGRPLGVAIASGVAIGIFFLALGTGQRGHGFDGLLAARVGSVACLLLLALTARTPLLPPRATFGTILTSGTMDMAANACYVLAAQTGALAVASVLTSLYPASTVFLARFLLGERLEPVQRFGVALALIGVALIAA